MSAQQVFLWLLEGAESYWLATHDAVRRSRVLTEDDRGDA
jgi:hypothetical protein